MSQIIFSKYSNERDRRFAIRTDILEQDEKRWVTKTPLYPEGKEHISNMPKWNRTLDDLYKMAPFVSNKCQAEEGHVKLEYLEEENLAEYLDALLGKGRKIEAEIAAKNLGAAIGITAGAIIAANKNKDIDRDWQQTI